MRKCIQGKRGNLFTSCGVGGEDPLRKEYMHRDDTRARALT